MDGELNQSGVALALTLARYFKRGLRSCSGAAKFALMMDQGGLSGQKILLY